MQLPAIQTSLQMYSLLEVDRVAQLAIDLGLDLDLPEHRQVVQRVVAVLLERLSSEVSGVIVEPDLGLPVLPLAASPSASKNNAGLICALDQYSSDEVDPLQVPALINSWGVESIRNNYGLAKISLYYHPNEEQALKEKQLIAELHDYCRHQGISLLLKLMLYTPADETFSAEKFQQTQLDAVAEFRANCDIIALQYPQDALACATLTTELDIPWVVVGDGQEYEAFKEVLRDSLEGGAKGFLAGEVFWKELSEFGLTSGKKKNQEIDLDGIASFVKTSVRDRVIELARIVDEFAQPE